jgi:hypothetical protein
MYDDLERKETQLPISMFFKRKWQEPGASTFETVSHQTLNFIIMKLYWVCFVYCIVLYLKQEDQH